MVWCSTVKLAQEVSRCGGLGMLSAVSFPEDIHPSGLASAIAEMNLYGVHNGRVPYGVNIPLMHPRAEEFVSQCCEGKVPVVVTSAGSPKKYTARLQEAGCKVGHVVASREFAAKAVAAGVDFLIAEGVEAGGHNGVEGLTTLVLVQMIRDEFSLPLVAAGGIHDGYGLAAMLALGADGVQIGSRFACTYESAASNAYKEKLLRVREEGTYLATRAWGPTRMMHNAYSAQLKALEESGASKEEQLNFIGSGRSRKGILEGNLEEGELEVGQVAAVFRRVESVEEVFSHLLFTFERATRGF